MLIDVRPIVQLAEDAQLTEFGDAGQKDETQMPIHGRLQSP